MFKKEAFLGLPLVGMDRVFGPAWFTKLATFCFPVKVYRVPSRSAWGDVTYWQVIEDGLVVEATPGFHGTAHLFSLRQQQEITITSIVRWIGNATPIFEKHRIRVTFSELNQQTVVQFVSWYYYYAHPERLPPTDRLEKQLEREAASTNLPFTIEVLPKPVRYKAG